MGYAWNTHGPCDFMRNGNSKIIYMIKHGIHMDQACGPCMETHGLSTQVVIHDKNYSRLVTEFCVTSKCTNYSR